MFSEDGINLKSDYGEHCNLTSGDHCSTSDGVSLMKGNYCLYNKNNKTCI
jgi:hypothetical protein